MSDVPRGRFVWYELMTTDVEAAKRFYGDVVGWTDVPFENAPMPYTIWMNGQAPVGGLMELMAEQRAQGVPPNWLIYISTPDVDDTLKRAVELGGNVLLEAHDIPEVGRIAVLADAQGAVFAAYRPVHPTPNDGGPPVSGQFSWHELAAADQGGAWDFYHTLFDWEKTGSADMGEAGLYQMFGADDVPWGGIFDKPPEMPGPPFWLGYVRVSDLDAAVQRVRDLGGQVLVEPMEVPGGDRIAQCLDPQGAAFALHSSASA